MANFADTVGEISEDARHGHCTTKVADASTESQAGVTASTATIQPTTSDLGPIQGHAPTDYDDSGDRTIFRHCFARSVDNGGTWTDEPLQELDPSVLSNGANGFLWGDYEV